MPAIEHKKMPIYQHEKHDEDSEYEMVNEYDEAQDMRKLILNELRNGNKNLQKLPLAKLELRPIDQHNKHLERRLLDIGTLNADNNNLKINAKKKAINFNPSKDLQYGRLR